MQRRYIEALLSLLRSDDHEDYVGRLEPDLRRSMARRMVDASRIFVYTWDARPFPAFPLGVVGVGGRRQLGARALAHGPGGRRRRSPRSCGKLLEDYGFTRYEVTRLVRLRSTGFVIDRLMSAREALQPLGLAYSVRRVRVAAG